MERRRRARQTLNSVNRGSGPRGESGYPKLLWSSEHASLAPLPLVTVLPRFTVSTASTGYFSAERIDLA